ncbi:hypothetical protein HHK36_023279 [Tetracentron sinense]|uniref:Cytochrome P450 n=1 Tax=Tetracentron sinense TaxID=13715 RepID=A0A835D8J2_TETSI|nr:hypothetical protein HHK36_023279 [Tetracentron sinense]
MNTNLVERLMGTIYESNPKDQLSRVAVLTLFVATVSIFLFIWSFKKSRKGRVQLPPGPRGLPIIGYVPFLDSDLHRSFAELAKIYGPIMKLQIGSKLSVVLSSASLAKEVLRDQDITFANRDPPIAASTIANGGADIAWSPYGPTWRMLRKYYHEMLHSSSLVCSARRRDVVEKAVREVYNKNGTPINIAELSFLTIFEVVISMLWGDTGEESGIKGEFYEMAEKLVELMDKSNISDLYPILAPFDIQGVEGEMKKLMQRFDHIFDPIIDQRLKLKGERIPNKKGNKDFLQFLLEREEQEDNENPMTRTEIKALIMHLSYAKAEEKYNLKNPTVKRILQEVKEMQANPSDDFMSLPLKSLVGELMIMVGECSRDVGDDGGVDSSKEEAVSIRSPKDSRFDDNVGDVVGRVGAGEVVGRVGGVIGGTNEFTLGDVTESATSES